MNELISVIVPLYNAEATIDDCIQSLKRQTYANIEVILIDDKSTDGSISAAEKSIGDDARFRLIRSPRNCGVSAARNIGIRASAGKWLTFVDSDDAVCDDLIEFLYNRSRETDDCFRIGPMCSIHDDGEGIGSCERTVKISGESELTVDQYIADINGYRPGIWACLFRADIIRRENILFCEAARFGEDACFVIRYAALFNRITLIKGTGYIYRIHANSLSYHNTQGNPERSASMIAARATIVEAYREAEAFLAAHRPALTDALRTGRCFPIANILYHMLRQGINDRALYLRLKALLKPKYALRYARSATFRSYRVLVLGMCFAPRPLTALLRMRG